MIAEDVVSHVRDIYERFAASTDGLRVLDAGCGRRGYLPIGDRAHLTGIDVSEEQLRHNERLDERIVGDLETYPLPRATYDVVICWDVLEHLRHPRDAIVRMAASVKPHGLLIIAGPHPRSLKAMLAKLSTHRIHVWLFRFLNPDAAPDDLPFRTYLKRDSLPQRVERHVRQQGLSVVYHATYESRAQVSLRERLHLTGAPWRAVKLVVTVMTVGMIDPELTEFVAVFVREPGATAWAP
jgi:SAM-dependent methyltransferase